MNRLRKIAIVALLVSLVPASGWGAGSGMRRQGPPPEALAVCEGRTAGDAVQFTNRRGETVSAICREKGGRLVAQPDFRQAGKRGGVGCNDDERHLSLLTEKLNLSKEQQGQVATILATERERTAPLKDKMKESRDNLRAAIHSGTSDEDNIRALATSQAAIEADLLVARAQAWQQIYANLTPEQRELAKKTGPFGDGPEGGKGKRKGRHHRG